MKYENNLEIDGRHAERLERANESMNAVKDIVKRGIYRQKYHFTSPAYWMNDPNGFAYFNGKYHLYYQCNPYSTVWANMHWGHATSEDLIHWEHQPVAIAPSEPYDDSLKGGIWSGSSLVYDSKLFALYTACIEDGESVSQKQCLVWSEDGYHFHKYEGNPVLEAPEELESENFRDPKIWEHDGRFYCVVASRKNEDACAGIFTSDDMVHWEYGGVLFQSRGMYGNMWECPDFFELDGKFVLQVCPMNMGYEKSVCFVGTFDYETLQFSCHKVYESDAGFDFYAGQTTLSPDGRRIMMGYQNSWPWMPWFQDYGHGQLENWCSCMGLPRELRFDEKGELCFLPVEETKQLREEKVELGSFCIPAGEKKEIAVGDGVHFELQLEFDLKKERHACQIHLRNSEREDTLICLDFARDYIIVDRNRSYKDMSAITFGINEGKNPGRISRKLSLKGEEKLKLQIFSDTSGIEVFVGEGEQVFTWNIFPDSRSNRMYLEAMDTEICVEAAAWTMPAK